MHLARVVGVEVVLATSSGARPHYYSNDQTSRRWRSTGQPGHRAVTRRRVDGVGVATTIQCLWRVRVDETRAGTARLDAAYACGTSSRR